MSRRVVVFNNMITPYTNRLYNELVGRGLDLAVLSCTVQEPDRSWAGSYVPKYEHRIVPGISLPLSRSRHTHVNVGIWRALNAMSPDILFVNGFYPSMLSAAGWARVKRKTLALTIDGWRETMPDTLYHRLARRWLLGLCRAVVCCSEKGRDYFRELGFPADRLFVVPLVPAWDPPAELAPFAERSFDLLWCARINDDAKNARFFEDVAVALRRSLPALKVRIVGTGPAEPRMLTRLAASGVDVTHDAHLAWDRLAAVYLKSRLLLLPSLLEPWGLVCNEAMQCGVPCLVSQHVGAGDELVNDGKNGYILELEEQAWVQAALDLLRDAARWSAMSVEARHSGAAVTVELAADRFMAVVDRLAEQGA
jgi:glycosyltransferase involved in cell wall biosynthesis